MSIGKIMLAAGFAVLVPLAAIPAEAEAPAAIAGGFHGGHHHAGFGFLQGVTLTDTQKTQVHQLFESSRTTTGPLAKQLRALHQQISDTLASNGQVDGATLTKLQQQASEVRAQMDEARLSMALQVRALLTPAQIAQAATTHKQLESLHQQMRGVLQQGQTTSATPE